ncbi:MAG: class I SAM-dependent methyltransferase [Betaproteobacteria bacterium]|nr:MAG: class I SAM-dependent methyltransferase [Betaproteobacteria bacterium]
MAETPFTGERFLPGCTGEIAYEHWHRYAFARQFVLGKRVLDAACGEGYGAALLGEVAASVVGVDIDADAIAQASSRYARSGRVSFVEGSCTSLAFPDASFDLVVSFETIEHVTSADQPRMLEEFARVLKRDGLLVLSSPNKRLYSDERNYFNEFHLHELYRAGLSELLAKHFPAQRWHHQAMSSWSGIWAEGSGTGVEAWLGDADRIVPYAPPEGMYFIVVAARSPSALPEAAARGSLFTDADQTEQKRNEANVREVLRLDALLREWGATLGKQAAHIHHLESLVAERDRIIRDMDGRLFEQVDQRDATISKLEARVAEVLGALATEQRRLEAELTAQQRVIAYRQSARWWLQLPWLRMRLWLSRSR